MQVFGVLCKNSSQQVMKNCFKIQEKILMIPIIISASWILFQTCSNTSSKFFHTFKEVIKLMGSKGAAYIHLLYLNSSIKLIKHQ